MAPAPGARPLLSGQSYDVAFPSPFQQGASINQIGAVEYRVDGGAWLPANAADGVFDSGDEIFATTMPLYDGEYLVEVRARNSAGAVSPIASRRVSVSQVGSQPDYRASLPLFTVSAEVQIQLGAPAGTQAVQISAQPGFGSATWQSYAPELPFSLDRQDGKQTVYVRYRDAAGLPSLPIALSVMLDTTPPDGSATRDPQNLARLILKAHDSGSGVAQVGIQIGDGAALWLPYRSAISLSSLDTSDPDLATMRVLFRDTAGNTSAPYAVGVGSGSAYQVFMPLVMR